ncbi:MAG: PIG-L family deacetylase [bacterium]|nr:PIG-L family deacetylase [bacterium]
MNGYFKIVLFGLLLYVNLSYGSINNLLIDGGEKILIFAPHPDDEVLGCAGVIQKAIKSNANVYIVYLTNGDHNQIPYRFYEKKLVLKPSAYIELGEIRRKESTKATGMLGIPSKNLIFLGYPDFGTLKIWENYWKNNEKPFMSFLTRATKVPYKENYSFGKPYISESILGDIKQIINDIRPSKIFITSNYDTNVDHRALYNFVRVALLDMENKPDVFIYLVHFKGHPQKNSQELLLPDIFSNFYLYKLSLEDNEIQNKMTAIQCFKSQVPDEFFISKKHWMFSFTRGNEIFYKEDDISLEREIKLESEREAEFESYINKSYPFYILLTKSGEFLNIEFIHRKRILVPTGYIFYFFPYKYGIEFSKMPKNIINLTKEKEVVTSEDNKYVQELKYERLKNKISFRIKLSDLNYPDYLFFSSSIKTGGITYDFIPWEVIKIK